MAINFAKNITSGQPLHIQLKNLSLREFVRQQNTLTGADFTKRLKLSPFFG